MKIFIFFGAFALSIFLIKSFYEPTTPAQIKQESIDKLKKAKLGLVSKKRITKNIEKDATVWEEIYRVERGVVKFNSSVFEYMPNKFTTMLKVKHSDLKGKTLYSRSAYSQSKSISIYRYGKNGVMNERTGLAQLIDFKKDPSDQCLRNRFKLTEISKACNATLMVQTMLHSPRLKITPINALFFDSKGKLIKNISAKDADYSRLVKAHLKQVYIDAKIVDALKEPRI